ncbi:MAG: hypothetical protein QGF09_09085 [Rhodospirillales bacterium]|jgi:hypothetical protein|nr:hypothetical protein [Rhodospirillales bacterium]
MKIAVYGPERRPGAIQDGNVVDLSHAHAKILSEKDGVAEPDRQAEA